MKSRASDSVAGYQARSLLDTVIEWLMAALLMFMPLAFGAVEAWSEMICVVIASVMAVCLMLKLVTGRGVGCTWHWAYVPAGLFLALVALQQVALPRPVVETVSPSAVDLKGRLLKDLPDAETLLSRMTLSLYPHATRHGLRNLLVAAILFAAVLNVYRRPKQIKRLLRIAAIIGGILALVALAQLISGARMVYWLVPPESKDVAKSATFANPTHFGQFMSLSMGAALALLLVELREKFEGVSLDLAAIVERLGAAELRIVWYLAGIVVVGTATVFLSLARGSLIALLIAGGFTTIVLALKRGLKDWRWIVGVVMAMLAFVIVLHVGFEAAYERRGSRYGEDTGGEHKQIVRDTLLAWRSVPLAGSGLHTHEVAYRMFAGPGTAALTIPVNNQYARIAEETGLLGISLFAVFAFLVWRSYCRCVRRLRPSMRVAVFGLGFGLLALMVQGLFDFHQHVLANMCLSAICAALVIGLGHMRGLGRIFELKGRRKLRRRLAAAAACVPAVAVCAWAVISANHARVGESHKKRALEMESKLRAKGWLGNDDDHMALISYAQAAADAQSDNAEYVYWLNICRWRFFGRVTDLQTGELVVTGDILRDARRAVRELQRAQVSCPTFGPICCLIGQLEWFVLNEGRGAEHIRTGYEMGPRDAMACYAAGLMDAIEGRLDAAQGKFWQCLKLDSAFYSNIVSVCILRVDQPRLAVAAAGDNFWRLIHVAEALENPGDKQQLAAQARSGALTLLRVKCDGPDAGADLLAAMANLCRRSRDYLTAIEYLRLALAQDASRVEWRLAMALCLAETGKVTEASQEAELCLRLRPEMEAAKRLISKLDVMPQALEDGEGPLSPN